MRIVSPILKRVVYPSLGKAGYLRRHSASFLSVVTYHGVLPYGYRSRDQCLDSALVSIENFRSQLRLLKSDYNVVSCEEFRSWLAGKGELPSRATLITCDDGLLNNLTDMLPVLQEEGLDCLFFVTVPSAGDERVMLWHQELYLILALSKRTEVDFSSHGIEVKQPLGDPRSCHSSWLRLLKRLWGLSVEVRRAYLDEATLQCGLQHDWKCEYFEEPLRRRFALLTSSEVQQLCDAGMTVGSHSLSHPALKQQTAQVAQAEIVDSRKRLLDISQSVWAFAYPFGDEASAGDREFELAQKAGFQCAFMNTEGCLSASSPRYALPRIHVTGEMSLREFEAHVSGLHWELRSRFA